jgi:hypothetical protein
MENNKAMNLTNGSIVDRKHSNSQNMSFISKYKDSFNKNEYLK